MNTLMDLPVPGEDDLYAMIAARWPAVTPERARDVLAAHGIRLARPLPARRSMCVHRLYCEGAKTGTLDNDGSFTFDLALGPGPWVLASRKNSAGKSNVLWALSWALRGESFSDYRRAESSDWFRYIRADIEVAGVPASIRITFDKPGHPSAELLTADGLEHLLALQGREDTGERVRVAARAHGAEPVKQLIGRFMLDRLGLRTVSVWAAEPGAPREEDRSRDSTEQVHGWASFYYALALNAGHERVLLGPTSVGALPARLMQIFLDIPYVTELSEIAVAVKAFKQTERHGQRRAQQDTKARQSRRDPLVKDLADARTRLALLASQAPDLRGLLTEVEGAARQVSRLRDTHDALEQGLRKARKQRIADQRALRWANESAAARMLLGALDPEVCPRCDTEIGDDRREEENTQHRCAVCTSGLAVQPEDPQSRAEALDELERRMEASRRAESSNKRAHEQAEADLAQAQDRHERAAKVLEQVRSADSYTQVQEAAAIVYRLEGALDLIDQDSDDTSPAQPLDHVSDLEILQATEGELRNIVRQRSTELFRDVDTELVRLAQALGVTHLTSVNLNLNGHVNARKSGQPARFAAFSPGERLRMRIATVIAMITVGHRHGIDSHPGLLLIDAPTAEEVVPGDAETVLTALRDVAIDIEGMQLIITSMNDALWDVFPPDRIIRSSVGAEGRYMF